MYNTRHSERDRQWMSMDMYSPMLLWFPRSMPSTALPFVSQFIDTGGTLSLRVSRSRWRRARERVKEKKVADLSAHVKRPKQAPDACQVQCSSPATASTSTPQATLKLKRSVSRVWTAHMTVSSTPNSNGVDRWAGCASVHLDDFPKAHTALCLPLATTYQDVWPNL